MELLHSVHKEGATICIVTRDPRYAGYAGRTIHLFGGRIVEESISAPAAAVGNCFEIVLIRV